MRLGMGLVGPGFVGAHHLDAVRRLGFVDVVAIAGADEVSARARADALGVSKSYGSVAALVTDPEVHVVHVTTPNHLHGAVIRAALAHRKHVVCEKPLAGSAAEALELWNAAEHAGMVHAITFNYRGNAMVQQARTMVATGELGDVHYVHGAYLQDWLLKPNDYSWRLEPERGGRSSAFADIGSHWCDLAQHLIGRPIVAVMADLTTVIRRRIRPTRDRAAFAAARDDQGVPFDVRSEDLATVLVRFEGGAKGCVSIGQVCAGHKNDLWIEANGTDASVRWRQEQQNELWIGHRDMPNMMMTKDARVLGADARPYARLPAGHQEGWSDAFGNVIRDIYARITRPADPAGPAFATFADGYRIAALVDAVLESHASGGAWVTIPQATPSVAHL